MDQKQLEDFKKWFTEFVSGFYKDDDAFINKHIQLKECHTHRVCNEMRQLTAALKMHDNDAWIAETIALFHDVGRFPQLQIYRTYKDEDSENHCLLALKVLAEHDILADLPDDERAIIEKAIEFHGVKDLPALDERTMFFAKLIRDADKIDIFDLLIKYYRQMAENPEDFGKEVVEYSFSPECNPEIIDALMNGELIHYEQIKTINDAKLMQLGWVYDVNFDWSLKQIHDREYLQTIIELLPEINEVRQVTECVISYVRQTNSKFNLISYQIAFERSCNMAFTFIADGRLYVRDENGDVQEVESHFINEKLNRSERSEKYSGWKQNSSPEDMYFGGPAIWGRGGAAGSASAFRFKDVITADDNTLYYVLTNNVVTGLFRYDMTDGFETRLFHSNELTDCGIDYSPTRKEFVISVLDSEGRAGIRLLNEGGSEINELTSGDSRDAYPSFSLRNPNCIYFQSSGIARDESGFAMMYGPEMIYKLDLEKNDMQEVLSDENYDFLLPKEDRSGNLYFVRRPYQMPGRTSLGRVILNTILFPFHFAVAVVGFLNAFTKLFNQHAFKANPFSRETPQQQKHVNVLGKTINLAKLQRNKFSKKEPSLVPSNWELVRMLPDQTFEVIAHNVASYDIDTAGTVHYTNGYRVHSMLSKKNTMIFRHRVIEKIKSRSKMNFQRPVTQEN